MRKKKLHLVTSTTTCSYKSSLINCRLNFTFPRLFTWAFKKTIADRKAAHVLKQRFYFLPWYWWGLDHRQNAENGPINTAKSLFSKFYKRRILSKLFCVQFHMLGQVSVNLRRNFSFMLFSRRQIWILKSLKRLHFCKVHQGDLFGICREGFGKSSFCVDGLVICNALFGAWKLLAFKWIMGAGRGICWFFSFVTIYYSIFHWWTFKQKCLVIIYVDFLWVQVWHFLWHHRNPLCLHCRSGRACMPQ